MSTRLKEYGQEELSAQLQTEAVILLQFGTDWCAPCKRQERVMMGLADTWRERLSLGKVNVEDWPQIAEEHQVKRNPTLCLFLSGRLTHRHEGYLDSEKLAQFLENALPPSSF